MYVYRGGSENTDQCSSMSAVGQVSSFECVVYLLTPAPYYVCCAALHQGGDKAREGVVWML